MSEVTASVSSPTPLPERPTLYLVVFYDERGYWAIDSLHGVKNYADMKHTTRPGSVLVTIPGTTTSAPAGEKELDHGMNCGYWTEQDMVDCTCGLYWRKALQTEQTMHAAWRKRAEEAEKELHAIRTASTRTHSRV